MGEALYEQLAKDHPEIACRTYAPVGSHRDLLAYLVRRLLENGANSSFVAEAADYRVPVRRCCSARPMLIVRPQIRRASRQDPAAGRSVCAGAASIRAASNSASARRSTGCSTDVKAETTDLKPIADCNAGAGQRGGRRGARGLCRPGAGRRQRCARRRWSGPPICWRAARAHFIALLQREGGKTLDDALSELREAADFCRYYAAQGRKLFGQRDGDAGPDRREQRARHARPRRLRRDLAVEFSAGDLPRPGHGGADGRQQRGGKARRADAAHRARGRRAAARGRHPRKRAASRHRRRPHRRRADRAP